MSLTLIAAVPSDPDDDAFRADLVTRYVTAADWAVQLALLAEAIRYDNAHPDALSLADELHAADLGDAA